MDAETVLKPCPNPWCAEKGRPYHRRLSALALSYVRCGQCGLQGPACETEAEAAAAWNTRPTVDAPAKDAEIEALRERVKALEEGLGPFAALPIKPEVADSAPVLDWQDGLNADCPVFRWTAGDFRRARALLATPEPSKSTDATGEAAK